MDRLSKSLMLGLLLLAFLCLLASQSYGAVLLSQQTM